MFPFFPCKDAPRKCHWWWCPCPLQVKVLVGERGAAGEPRLYCVAARLQPWCSGSLAVQRSERLSSGGELHWWSRKTAWVSGQLFWTSLQQWVLLIWWFLEISPESQTFVLFCLISPRLLNSCHVEFLVLQGYLALFLIYIFFHPSSTTLSISKPLFETFFFYLLLPTPLLWIPKDSVFLTVFFLFVL